MGYHFKKTLFIVYYFTLLITAIRYKQDYILHKKRVQFFVKNQSNRDVLDVFIFLNVS